MEPNRGVVLVVSPESGLTEGIGKALEKDGFEVMTCPGPSGPDYVCVGGRTGRCPLADGADGVVLDGLASSDEMMEGFFADELLAMYLAEGRPVVRLTHPGQARAVHGIEPVNEPSLFLLRMAELARSGLSGYGSNLRVELFEEGR
jgi:hypothetical protein